MEKTSKSSNGKTVQSIPKGYHTVTPYLVVERASEFIEFIKKAFDGKLTYENKGGSNKVMHATVSVGDSTIMVSDIVGDMTQETGMLYLYVDDVDTIFHQAIAANAISVREPVTEFYGDRAGCVKDKWGNTWWIATHVEDVSEEELAKRATQVIKDRQAQTETVAS